MKTHILFMPVVTVPGTEHYFRNYENHERYGIEVRVLTPQNDKRGYGFAVSSQGKRYRGYISSAGDFIVRLANQLTAKGASHGR